MDLGSFFLILGLLTLVGLYVARPLLEGRRSGRAAFTPAQQEASALLAERDRILNAIQELDFDNALGKIPEEDYPDQRTHLLQKGAQILRQLDSVQPAVQTAPAAEDRLEAAIAARRLAPAGPVPAGLNGKDIDEAGDELEVLIAQRRRSRQDKSAGFCGQCGGPVQKSDRFCPKCGSQLDET